MLVAVLEGQKIASLLGSANRDESIFERSNEMNLLRNPNPHIGFGAGDCFIGSFSYSLASGSDAKSAAEFACRIAAVSVTRKGAQSSYPTTAEISTLS